MPKSQECTSVKYFNTLSLDRPSLDAGSDICLLDRPSRNSSASQPPVSNPLEPSRTLSNRFEMSFSNPLEPSRTLSNLLEQVWESRTLSNPLEPSRTLSSRFEMSFSNPLEPSRTLSNPLEQVWESRTLSNPLEPSRTLSNLLEQVWEFCVDYCESSRISSCQIVRSPHQCKTSNLLRSAGHQMRHFLII